MVSMVTIEQWQMAKNMIAAAERQITFRRAFKDTIGQKLFWAANLDARFPGVIQREKIGTYSHVDLRKLFNEAKSRKEVEAYFHDAPSAAISDTLRRIQNLEKSIVDLDKRLAAIEVKF
jgi:hypothetical protein